MANIKGINIKFKGALKYLAGLLFLVPGGEMVFLLWLLLDVTNEKAWLKLPDIEKTKISAKILLVSLPAFLLLGFLSNYLLEAFNRQDAVNALKLSEGKELFYSFLLIVLVVPVLEEFYFRLILFELVEKTAGAGWAILVAAFFFSLVHVNIYALPILFFLGLVLGAAKRITGHWLTAVLGHSAFNFLMFVQIKLI